jgi:hypothetical protein
MVSIYAVIREVENTIAILETQKFIPDFAATGGLMQIESEKLKLAALREKAARENPQSCDMCRSCIICSNSGRAKCVDDCDSKSQKHFETAYSYCPMCGRKLPEVAQ